MFFSVNSSGDIQRTLSQLDGPHDYHPHGMAADVRSQTAVAGHMHSNTQASTKQYARTPKSAINDILPYCTAELPLTQDQVIGLSDIAGNLKEVMLLALHAKVDECFARHLVRAVGQRAATGIVDFFSDEFEVGSV
jgi:hypothetical protein